MAKASILIVEDEAIVAADIADKLERAGYRIMGTVSRGEQALRIAQQTRPDLVLMDVRLAGPLDGIEVAESLKASTDVPVVFLTAHSDSETIKRAGLTDLFGYILKPFEERDLVTQIEIALYRYQAERALRDSETRYRTLVETASDGILTINEQGTIQSCNAATERMFGYSREDMVGRNLSMLMPEAFPEGHHGPLERFITSETGGVIGGARQSRGRRSDESVFPVEISLSRAWMGSEIMYTGIVRDFTERHRIHQEVCRLANELEHRVNDRTKDLVALQERLRSLATELSLAEQRERKRLAAELHDHLAQLLVLSRMKVTQASRIAGSGTASERLLVETADVLDQSLRYTRTLVADLSPTVLHDFGLPAAIKWLCDYMKQYDLRVHVRSEEEELSYVPEDQALLLFQSVRELLMNVCKHAGVKEATVQLSQRNGALRIEVRDDGQGFNDVSDVAPSDKFGLFSVKQRMIALGGQLDVRSSPGTGTSATLILPLHKPAAAVDATVPSSSKQESGTIGGSPLSPAGSSTHPRSIRVVLADDHTVVRQGLRSLLESYDDMVVVGEAGNGIAAIALVEALLPDVVVMDINMPEMNGVEATSRIKAQYPSVDVIGLSMHHSDQYVEEMKAAGAVAYLTKDSVADHLYNLIRARRPSDHPPPNQEKTEGLFQARLDQDVRLSTPGRT